MPKKSNKIAPNLFECYRLSFEVYTFNAKWRVSLQVSGGNEPFYGGMHLSALILIHTFLLLI